MIRGRKRKSGSRYACGKIKREETEREAMATALAARQRHYGVTGKQARDERLGTSLGRLVLRKLISDTQYQAGVAFGELYQRHHIVMGLPTPSPRSVAGVLINEGIFGSAASEHTLELIDRLRQRFQDATDALDQCDRDNRFLPGGRPTLLIYRVVCADEETKTWRNEDIGNLRFGLNALARVFKL